MQLNDFQQAEQLPDLRLPTYGSNTPLHILAAIMTGIVAAAAYYLGVPWYFYVPLLVFAVAKMGAALSLHGRRIETQPDVLRLVARHRVSEVKWENIKLILLIPPHFQIREIRLLPQDLYLNVFRRFRTMPRANPETGWSSAFSALFAGATTLLIYSDPQTTGGARKFVFCIPLTTLDRELLEAEIRIRASHPLLVADREALQQKFTKAMDLYQRGNEIYGARKLPEAEQAFAEALQLFREVGHADRVSMSLAILGDVYAKLGKLDDALEHTLEGLRLARSLGELVSEASCWLHLGRIQVELGNVKIDKWKAGLSAFLEHNRLELPPYELGAERLLDSVECHLRAYQSYDRAKEWLFAAKTLGNLGMALQIYGEYELAKRCHERALRYYKLVRDIEGQHRELGGIADCYRETGHYADAVRHYEAALRFGPKIRGGIPDDLCGLAISLLKRDGIYTLRVRELIDRALHSANVLGPLTLYVVHDRRGQVFELLQDPEQAHQEYEQSIQVIEQMRRSLAEDLEKIGFFNEQKMEVYKRMISLCHSTLNKNEDTFNYVERARSRAFLDILEQSLREAISLSADPSGRWPMAEGLPVSCVEVKTCLQNV